MTRTAGRRREPFDEHGAGQGAGGWERELTRDGRTVGDETEKVTAWEHRRARRGGAHSELFNIASYSLLTMMIAQVCRLEPGEFVLTLGDAHLYLNHLEQVDTQLSRDPYPLPTMHLHPGIDSLFDFRYEHFRLENYRHHPSIRAPIAV